MTSDNKDKTTVWVERLLKLIFIMILIISALFIRWINRENNIVAAISSWFLFYFSFLLFLSCFNRFRIVRIIQAIIGLPAALMIATAPFFDSLIAIVITYFTVFGIALIGFFNIPVNLFKLQIEKTTSLYLALTITSIVMTAFGDRVIKIWHEVQNKSYKDQSYKLSLKILDERKARVVIFGFYLILIIIFTVASLNKTPIFHTEKLDIAILQSFATYVAYDRLVSNFNSTFYKEKT